MKNGRITIRMKETLSFGIAKLSRITKHGKRKLDQGSPDKVLPGTVIDNKELVHSLSYVYQKSTTAISVVASICYIHLAALQLGQFMKFMDASETSSSHVIARTAAGAIPFSWVYELRFFFPPSFDGVKD
ncbi:hypothetical protein J1N35_005143 [Gossypium stocksii]|uniref:Uncharacterized protein n=1 Tax=Gossypium stocksii TaxID=47602 RepID=A0A9D4AIQ4_9ROSI|nr:hypothetical protein J1N35_005143 [Gossypium stocksii]